MSGRSPLAQPGLLPRLRVYTDPLQHALIAAAVAAPLVPRAGWRVILTAVTAATVIDVDHAVAARSVRVRATTSLSTRRVSPTKTGAGRPRRAHADPVAVRPAAAARAAAAARRDGAAGAELDGDRPRYGSQRASPLRC